MQLFLKKKSMYDAVYVDFFYLLCYFCTVQTSKASPM